MEKDEIKEWLTQIGKDRPWLAGQIGCTVGTLNQWFSKLGFPDWALKSIQRLMHPQGDTSGLEVTFSAKEFELIEQARKLSEHPTRAAYYRDAIMEYTDHLLGLEKSVSQSTGMSSSAAQPVASPSNITHLHTPNPLEYHHRAADEPGDTSDIPTPTKVSYGSGKRRKSSA